MFLLASQRVNRGASLLLKKNSLCTKDRENDFNFELYYFPGKLSGIDPEKVHRHCVFKHRNAKDIYIQTRTNCPWKRSN